MNHYVYEITNLVNGKKYIGKRSCKCPIEEDKYMGSGKALKDAFSKYGIHNFKKEILYICNSSNEAYDIERKLIDDVSAWENSHYYNLVKGGISGNDGIPMREEVKVRLSKRFSNENNPMYGKKGILAPCYGRCGNKHPMYGKVGYWRGKSHSEETKLKISKSKQNPSKETRKKMSEWQIGKKLSQEHKNKISNSIKGDKHPLYGKSHSEETRKKISKSLKGKRTGSDSPVSKKIICITTGDIFNCLREAGELYNIKCYGGITNVCKHKRKTCGKLADGTPLEWMYYEDYLKTIK